MIFGIKEKSIILTHTMQYKYTQANGFVVQGHIFVFIFVFCIFLFFIIYIFQDSLMDGNLKKHLFEIKIFCNNVKAFTVTFDQVNAFSV